MKRSACGIRGAWLTAFGALARYHRYRVEGLDNLPRDGAAMIVGYHGRPVAWDLCMLTVALNDRLGYLPHGVVHRLARENRVMSAVVDALGFVTGDGPELAASIAAGEHLLVAPAAYREALRGLGRYHRVDWGHHSGYVRLAARHGLPIVPVGGYGGDLAYVGLLDGRALARVLGLDKDVPMWLGVGPLGPFPFSPPFPVRMRQVVGEPISVAGLDPGDEDGVAAVHECVQREVQALIQRARRLQPPTSASSDTWSSWGRR